MCISIRAVQAQLPTRERKVRPKKGLKALSAEEPGFELPRYAMKTIREVSSFADSNSYRFDESNCEFSYQCSFPLQFLLRILKNLR